MMQSIGLENQNKSRVHTSDFVPEPQYELNSTVDNHQPSEPSEIKAAYKKRAVRISSNNRPYCVYSFELIDIKNKNSDNHSIVQCEGCNGLYYEVYWNSLTKCVRPSCNHTTAQPVKISTPVTRRVQEKTQPILPETEVYDLTNDEIEIHSAKGAWRTRLRNLLSDIVYKIRTNLTAIILLTLGVSLGSFTFRIWTLLAGPNPSGLVGILNAILRVDPPPLIVFINSLLASLLIMYVFYPRYLLNGRGKKSFMRRVIRFIAVVQLLAIYNYLLLYDITNAFQLDPSAYTLSEIAWLPYPWRHIVDSTVDSQSLPSNLIVLISFMKIIFAQIGSIAIIILLAPIYRINSARPTLPQETATTPRFFRAINVTSSFIRYCFVIIGLALFSAFIVLTNLFIDDIRYDSLTYLQPSNISIEALLTSLSVAVIFYWPPMHKAFTAKLVTLRLIISVGLLIYSGYLYSQTSDPTTFLQISGLTAIIAFVLLPIQRAFS